jgi:hypothetical protein
VTDESRIIPGYEGRYTVNRAAVVWDTKRNRALAQFANRKTGIYVVYLRKDGRQCGHTVARLVLQAFDPVDNDLSFYADWIDEDRANNAFENLRWKRRVPGKGRLTEADVREIRKRYDAGEGCSEIAKSYPVKQGAVSHAALAVNWKWVEEQ